MATQVNDLQRAIEGIERLYAVLSDPVKLAEYEEQLRAARAARKARHDAKWQAWLDRMTDQQEALVAAYRQDGAELVRMYRDRDTGNIAAMLVKRQVWNHAKARMGQKLVMVYPDGARTETLEKTISVKKHF